MSDGANKPVRGKKPLPPRKRTFSSWSKDFISHLAATSNVAAAAREAGVDSSLAYRAKRTNPEFNRQWRQALCEGYDLLEMELLQRLRAGAPQGGDGKRVAPAHDNAIAFRLLVAHRAEAARQRGVRDNQDSEAILLSINAKIEKMRQRRLATLGLTYTPSADEDE
jgi:hypothetical protein